MIALADLKTCYACKMAKARTAFSGDKSRKDGLQPRCKECATAYRAANYDRVSARAKERMVTYRPAHYAANAERIRQKSREWFHANRDKSYARVAQYRAGRREATPAWADMKAIQKFYTAARILSTMTGEPWHVDHIVPLNSKLVCGLHCEANLQLLPGGENVAKGNRTWPGKN